MKFFSSLELKEIKKLNGIPDKIYVKETCNGYIHKIIALNDDEVILELLSRGEGTEFSMHMTTHVDFYTFISQYKRCNILGYILEEFENE